jgi:hypothetical protein
MSKHSVKSPAKSRQCKRTLMDDLHWRDLYAKTPTILHRNIAFLNCLGYLGRSDIKRNNPICVASPQVAKASTICVAVAGIIAGIIA